ncbi:MAG: AarF/ABC1/UbiB kinase family protein [Thermodesulfobacteriota bacterium]|nr:AarF/ABC1/UbiB kinase family protein [Thermodesulfobacteriota bacterium]
MLTVFVIVRKKEHFFYIRPLDPVAFKQTILDLGVSFIKLAQVLATRADFFTEEYLRELKTIHDEVEPMDRADFEVMYNRAFGSVRPFRHFVHSPIASASIGQVHKAVLDDGTKVAVKIRRLNIEKAVLDDIRIIGIFLKIFQPFFSRLTKNSLEAVLNEFADMILKEVDLSIELDNLRKFREIYQLSGIRFPDVYPRHCSCDALVMSFEIGMRIDDKEGLARSNIPFTTLMDRMISFYMEQMLVCGLFHADPHPGNFLVGDDGTLIVLDFGMVKRLPNSTRVAMIEMIKAANEQDFELFIVSCKRLGVIAATAREDQMQELAVRMFDIFGNEHLNATSMQNLAFDVLDSMRELPFKVPQELVYVMRASSLVEGLGTSFIENFNGIKDILPVLIKNINRALGAENRLFPTLKSELMSLPLTVRRLKIIITQLSEDNLHIKLSGETLEILGEYVRAYLKPVGMGVVLITTAFFVQHLSFSHHQEVAVIFFILGVLRVLIALK